MKKLSGSGDDALNSKQVKTYAKVLINGVEVKPRDYSYSYDKSFGAASSRITLPNEDGKFSPYGNSPVKRNDSVVIKEGLYNKNNQLEKWTKFAGLIRQTVPRIEKGIQTIEVTALDKIVRLEDLDLYEHFFEADKVAIGGYAGVKLRPVGIFEGVYCQIYDFYDRDYDEDGAIQVTDIAPNPIPKIIVRNLTNYLSEPKWEGFEINYQTGQLILNNPINIYDYEICAIFSYYPIVEGLYVEDLIKDIITAPDGYGNYPISEDDIKTDLLTEDGISEDIMVPDYNEVEDGKTKQWFLNYNNIISVLDETPRDLGAEDFEIPGGANFIEPFDKRYGRLTLDVAIPLNSTVKCKANYNFWTIQATGIQTPYISFPAREIPNRFEALNQLRKLLAPNYIFQTRGDNKIWGRYLNQKVKEDYVLALKERIEYSPDTDVYTRVKLFGENASPANLMANADFVCGYEYIAKATSWPLWSAYVAKNDCFTFQILEPLALNMAQLLSNPQPPVIYVGGYTLGLKGDAFIQGHKDGDQFNDSNASKYGSACVGGLLKDKKDKHNGVWFIGALNTNRNITLTMAFGLPDEIIYPDDPYLKFNDDTHRYEWKPPWRAELFQAIIWTLFYANFGTDYQIDYTNNQFRIPTKYVAGSEKINVVRGQLIIGMIGDCIAKNQDQLTDGITYRKEKAQVESNCGSNSPAWEWLEINFKDWALVSEVRLCDFGKADGGTEGSQIEIQLHTLEGWKVIQHYGGNDDTYKKYLLYALYWDPSIIYLDNPPYSFPVYANKIKMGLRTGLKSAWGWPYSAKFRGSEIEVYGTVPVNTVMADFWYSANANRIADINNLKDGLFSTQVQSIYLKEPMRGSVWATFDFKSEKKIQAIDLVAGFYIPYESTPDWKFDTKMNLTLEYALDAIDLEHAIFYEISKEATGFNLNTGDKISFEPDDLGENFKMRWLRIKIESLDKIEGPKGNVYVLSLTELAVYSDIYLEAEAKLVPGGISFPESPEIDDIFYRTDEDKWYVYKSEGWEEFENETYVYDSLNLLATVGDRLHKDSSISAILNTQEKLDRRAKALLQEFVKEHTKVSTSTPVACHLSLGQTLKVVDPYTHAIEGESRNYFVDSISSQNGKSSLVLAYYP